MVYFLFSIKRSFQGKMRNPNLKQVLDDIYQKFNRRDYVHPDPLEFLYAYKNIRDREIAGLVAACLAYGRVAQINKSVWEVLSKMGPSPRDFITGTGPENFSSLYPGFVHRFAKTEQLSALLSGIKNVLEKYGSLYECFLYRQSSGDETVLAALNFFAGEIIAGASGDPGHLMPLPERGSAGKRLHLYLRWMVRKDEVDPGGWDRVPAAKLIVPLDVHMHRVCTRMQFTQKKQANLKTAIEITDCFKRIEPDDPVEYDFSLTRFGIRKEAEFEDFWDCP
jgi:uncharacterized protein (TIGR02757 family)